MKSEGWRVGSVLFVCWVQRQRHKILCLWKLCKKIAYYCEAIIKKMASPQPWDRLELFFLISKSFLLARRPVWKSNRQRNGFFLCWLNLFFLLPPWNSSGNFFFLIAPQKSATQLLWHHCIQEFMFTLSRCTSALHDNTSPQKQMAFTFPLGSS